MKIDTTALKLEERRQLASLPVEAGYRVNKGTRKVPNGRTSKTVHFVEYEEVRRE